MWKKNRHFLFLYESNVKCFSFNVCVRVVRHWWLFVTVCDYLFLLRISLSRSWESLCWSQRRSLKDWCTVWIYVQQMTRNACRLKRQFVRCCLSMLRKVKRRTWQWSTARLWIPYVLLWPPGILETNTSRVRPPPRPLTSCVCVVPPRRGGVETLTVWNDRITSHIVFAQTAKGEGKKKKR